MAAASTQLAPPPAPSDALAPPDTSGIASDMKALRTQQTQLMSDSDKVQSQALETTKGIEQERQWFMMHPPQMQTTPPPVPKTTNPTQAWGSMAMMAAALGSLFTRTPLTNALNAAAGVLTAYQKNDQIAFDTAFKTWQVADANATKVYEFQQKQYDAILGQLDKTENLAREEARDQLTEIRGKMTATASALHDDIMLDALSTNNWARVQQIHDSRDRLQLERLRTSEAVNEMGLIQQSASDFVQKFTKDNGKPPTADQIASHVGAVKASMSTRYTMDPVQRDHIEQGLQNQWKSDPLFKVWAPAAQYLRAMESVNPNDPAAVTGIVKQAGFFDQFTQSVNGGHAIRNFQQKMMTHDAGIWNSIAIAKNQVGKGGMLSPEMAHDMMSVAAGFAKAADADMRDAVYRMKLRAAYEGVNPASVAPPEYAPLGVYDLLKKAFPNGQPSDYFQAGTMPSEHAVDGLIAGKVTDEEFNQHFHDPNAAAAARFMRAEETKYTTQAEEAAP